MAAVTDARRQTAEEIGVLVVADAGADAGLGHIARCSAIAVALRTRGLHCRCLAVGTDIPPRAVIAWEPVANAEALTRLNPRLLLLDTYRLDATAVRARTGARRLAAMHDEGPLLEEADLIITSDPRVMGASANVVGGPELSPLGPRFWGLPEPPDPAEHVRRVLVTTGGGDPGGYAVAIARTVHDALADAKVTLVRGPHAAFADPEGGIAVLDRPPSLLEHLLSADMVVTAGGNTALEAAAVGIPTVTLVLAENQRAITGALAAGGATDLLDPAPLAELGNAVRTLAVDRELRRERVRRGREIVDGYGALRAAFVLAGLVDAVRTIDGPPA